MKNFIAAIAMIGTAILPMAAAATEEHCGHFEEILMVMDNVGGQHIADIKQDGEVQQIYKAENRYYILDWNDEEICSKPAPKWVVDQIKR